MQLYTIYSCILHPVSDILMKAASTNIVHLYNVICICISPCIISSCIMYFIPLCMGGGTGGYRGYMYPPPFLEGGYKRVHSVKVCVYPVVR